jgi:hypothetical protein
MKAHNLVSQLRRRLLVTSRISCVKSIFKIKHPVCAHGVTFLP